MAKVYPFLYKMAYGQEQIPPTADLMAMGLVNDVYNSEISQKGAYVKEAYQENLLTTLGAAGQITTTTTVTPVTGADDERFMVVVHRGEGIYDVRLNDILRGAISINQNASQWAKYWALQIQNSLIAATQGMFGTALAGHVLDATSTADKNFSISNLTEAQILVGNELQGLDTIIIHKNIWADVIKYVTYQPWDVSFNGLARTFSMPMIGGMRVLLNDTLCAVEETTKYPIYLVQGKPWSLYWQQSMTMYEDFDPAYGGGKRSLYTYVDYAPHVDGMSFDVASVTNPTDVQLATAGYWGLKTDTANIKINKLLVEKAG